VDAHRVNQTDDRVSAGRISWNHDLILRVVMVLLQERSHGRYAGHVILRRLM
jgi:hypothetical protein